MYAYLTSIVERDERIAQLGKKIGDLETHNHGLRVRNGNLAERVQELEATLAAEQAKLTKGAVEDAVARGWCHSSNAHKELDTDLVAAIVDEIMKLIPLTAQAEVLKDAGLLAAALALNNKVADMGNVNREDHWDAHSEDVKIDALLVIETYLTAIAKGHQT